eukprot:5633035-Amphidinium_carterae.1
MRNAQELDFIEVFWHATSGAAEKDNLKKQLIFDQPALVAAQDVRMSNMDPRSNFAPFSAHNPLKLPCRL